jgi:hypothetical protein
LEYQIERGTIMATQHVIRRAVKASVLAMVGTGVILVGTQTSFAQFRHQKSAQCQSMVSAKGLKGDQRKSEYQKCMMDPTSYK